MKPLQHRIEYLLLRVSVFVFQRMSIEGARKFLGSLGAFAARLPIKPRRIALSNLQLAYGDAMSMEQRKSLVVTAFRHLGWSLADFINSRRLQAEPMRWVTMHGPENYDAAKARKGAVMLLCFHFASWEWIAQFHALRVGKSNVLVKNQANPLVNAWVQAQRASAGVFNMPVRDSATKILRALKGGEDVCFVFDQHTKHHEAVFVPFFGRKCATARGLALLAMKLDIPVVGAAVWWNEKDQLEGGYYPEIPMVRTGNLEKDIEANTAAYNQFIEDRIREHPADWLWAHRRWRELPPEVEAGGG